MSKKKQAFPCRPSTLGKKGFAGIPNAVMESPAYRALHVRSRAILFEIAAKMNGYNNDKIVLSYEQLREATGCCNRDIASSINELWKHGLVEFRACENYNQHRAREYRLTFVSTVSGDFIKPATNDYLSWVPAKVDGIDQKKLGDKAQPAKPPAGDKAQPAPQYAGDKVQPAQKPKRRKTAENAIVTPQAAGDTTLPHIYIPYPPGQSNGPKGDDGYHNQPEIPVGDFDAMLRERLAAYWTGANRSDRKRLAESIRLPVDELASFANGGHLPHLKAAPLMCELARTAA